MNSNTSSSSPSAVPAESTRTRLLDAVGEAIALAGATTFTLEGIAKRAGVSKGALLHHFPTKSLLIEEFVKSLLAAFWEDVYKLATSDEEPHGRMTRAYANSVLAVYRSPAESRRWSGLMTAFVVNPSLMYVWRDASNVYQRALESETAQSESLMIARMAVDSYWSNQLFGIQSISSEARAQLISRIIELTLPVPERAQIAA